MRYKLKIRPGFFKFKYTVLDEFEKEVYKGKSEGILTWIDALSGGILGVKTKINLWNDSERISIIKDWSIGKGIYTVYTKEDKFDISQKMYQGLDITFEIGEDTYIIKSTDFAGIETYIKKNDESIGSIRVVWDSNFRDLYLYVFSEEDALLISAFAIIVDNLIRWVRQ